MQCKFATIQLVHALQRELGDKDGVVIIFVDPGNIKSDLLRHNQSFAISTLVNFCHLQHHSHLTSPFIVLFYVIAS
jgi:short-subunit dehydrogenase